MVSVSKPPDREGTANPSDSERLTNPLARALQAGKEDKGESQARRFISVLPWSALAATMIVSLRILMVAHLNLPVALQLVSLTDTAKVLLGLAILFFEPLLIFLALYVQLACTEILHDVVKAARSKQPFDIPNRGLLFICLWPLVIVMVIAFFSDGAGLWVLIGAALWMTQRIWLDTKPPDRSSPTEGRPKPSFGFRLFLIISGMLLMGIGFALVALNDTPWLPPERIVLTNGTAMVGYVVAESNSELTILQDKGRSISAVSVSRIRSQQLCQIGSSSGGGDLFVQLYWGSGPKVPACRTGR